MIFLGIDPGLQFAGFAIGQKNGQKIILLDCGYLKMVQSKSISERIHFFYDYFQTLIIKNHIQVLVLETPFLGKNAQNFLKLGYLRGILYLLAQQNKLQILEFTPMQVKLAVTGYGGASKEQVARVIKLLFPKLQNSNLKKTDVTDALAVMLSGAWQSQRLVSNSL